LILVEDNILFHSWSKEIDIFTSGVTTMKSSSIFHRNQLIDPKNGTVKHIKMLFSLLEQWKCWFLFHW